MPKILERLVQQLQADGKSKSEAYPIAVSQLQKHGILRKGSSTELTPKGKVRQAMGAAGRAKDRAAKRDGRKPGEYSYNPRTNQATLKKGGR